MCILSVIAERTFVDKGSTDVSTEPKEDWSEVSVSCDGGFVLVDEFVIKFKCVFKCCSKKCFKLGSSDGTDILDSLVDECESACCCVVTKKLTKGNKCVNIKFESSAC